MCATLLRRLGTPSHSPNTSTARAERHGRCAGHARMAGNSSSRPSRVSSPDPDSLAPTPTGASLMTVTRAARSPRPYTRARKAWELLQGAWTRGRAPLSSRASARASAKRGGRVPRLHPATAQAAPGGHEPVRMRSIKGRCRIADQIQTREASFERIRRRTGGAPLGR